MAEPTLHAEIRTILLQRGNAWTGIDELATQVNQRGRYHKKDQSAVQPSQIHLRTRFGGSYDGLFERQGQLVRLRDTSAAVRAANLPPIKSSALVASIPPPVAAVYSLGGPGEVFEIAVAHVPKRPGLYAIFGDASVWTKLGLGLPPDTRPLYIGKAERSLSGRDIGQHFSDGKTGSSTVRRSIAALLHDDLGLRGIPRNPSRPADFDRYGMSPDHDATLTAWMRGHLRIATWATTEPVVLADREREMVRSFEPPLNLTIARTKWSADISAKRARMAEEARNTRGLHARGA